MTNQNTHAFTEHLSALKDELATSEHMKLSLSEFADQFDLWWDQAERDIVARYNEPHRHYHDLAHVVDGLNELTLHNADLLTKLAYVYHDVIYVAGAQFGMNERASAAYAVQQLSALLHEDACAYIALAIECTINHTMPEKDPGPLATHLALMLDVDLAGLGIEHNAFFSRTADIYAEFCGAVAYSDFDAGSRAFAEKMLKQHIFGGIFKTDAYRHLEDAARDNLTNLAKGVFTDDVPT